MDREALGVFVVFAVFFAFGVGPALCLMRDGPRRLQYGFAVAPALGLLIAGLLGFPLYRFLGVPHRWAFPAAGVLLVGSAALTAFAWRSMRGDYPIGALPRRLFVPAALVGVLFVALVLPLHRRGIQYAVFRGNPGDAFIYMTAGQGVQEADLPTELRGSLLSDKEGVAALGRQSPTALFTARTLLIPLSLNRMVAHVWASELIRVPSWRFYYGFHLVAFLAAAMVALALAFLLEIPRYLAYLASGAVGIGFWARWVLESDASYQIVSTPLLLLLAFAWIQTELEEPGLFTRSRILLGISLAGVITFYAPFLQLLFVSGAVYYGLGLIQKTRPVRRVLLHGVSLGIGVALIAVTGQLDWVFRNTTVIMKSLGGVRAVGEVTSATVMIVDSDGVSGLWGVPATLLFRTTLPLKLLEPVQTLFQALAILLTACALAAAVSLLLRPKEAVGRIITAFAVAGCATFMGLCILDRSPNNVLDYSAGKAYTFIYPFPILLGLLYARFAKAHFTSPQARAISLCLGLWGVIQLMIGFYIPLKKSHRAPFDRAAGVKPEEYNIAPITNYLDQNNVRGLLVYTPRDPNFMFPLYLMFALPQYQPHYLSGLVIDNDPKSPNLWIDKIKSVPDFALVTRKADFIGPNHLGDPVAETRDLLLYRLTNKDLAVYSQVEDTRERDENARPDKAILWGQPGRAAP